MGKPGNALSLHTWPFHEQEIPLKKITMYFILLVVPVPIKNLNGNVQFARKHLLARGEEEICAIFEVGNIWGNLWVLFYTCAIRQIKVVIHCIHMYRLFETVFHNVHIYIYIQRNLY